MGTKTKKRKKAKAKLSSEERRRRKLKNDHMRSVRSAFRNMGFERTPEVAGVEIKFEGQSGEFDDAFLLENLLVLVEYTTAQSSDVTDHLKKKKIIFSKVLGHPKTFLTYLREKVGDFDKRLGDTFHQDKYIVKIIYCSLYEFDGAIKSVVNEPKYLDFPSLKYFEKLSSVIKMSALDEMLAFLDVEPTQIARKGIFSSRSQSVSYDGSILPESSSGFPPGYKVVSFYADAAALLVVPT